MIKFFYIFDKSFYPLWHSKQKLSTTFCDYIKKPAKKGMEKKILMSNDDEGNGYHELFFGISPPEKFFNSKVRSVPYLPFNTDIQEAINN